MREIQRQIVVVQLGGIPSRPDALARHLVYPGIHILNRNEECRCSPRAADPFDEASGVVTLPANGDEEP